MLKNHKPEESVRELEYNLNRGKPITPPNLRNLLLDFARVNIYERRGFTRDDIHYKTPNDRRGIIYRLKHLMIEEALSIG